MNPAHLFLGTKGDNSADKVCKSRQRSARGEDSGMAKLTEKDVLAIRKEYASTPVLQRELASKYGVSQSAIAGVVRRSTWEHVT